MAELSRHINHRGIQIPTFLYGTAWKEERTEGLTKQSLEAGFVGIDTANQRKHYFEAGVGAAVKSALDSGQLKREDLFLQTKFTFKAGQDHRLPYDPKADWPTQVQQSFASSLEHLHTDYIDSYILHGPSTRYGLNEADFDVWRAMESLHKDGSARFIGVSNIDPNQLTLLLEMAKVKPAFVQNRTYAQLKWDVQVREICQANDIVYQGFSLLTANQKELNQPQIKSILEKFGCTLPQLVFLFSLQIGMQPITGTTNPVHMKEDLEAYGLSPLSEEEMTTIENIAL